MLAIRQQRQQQQQQRINAMKQQQQQQQQQQQPPSILRGPLVALERPPSGLPLHSRNSAITPAQPRDDISDDSEGDDDDDDDATARGNGNGNAIKQQMQPIYSQHGTAITPAQPRDDISDDSEGDDDDDDDLPSGASWRELQPDVLNFSLPPGLAAKAK
jgi:type II secretory pathway pseudopilin PulG